MDKNKYMKAVLHIPKENLDYPIRIIELAIEECILQCDDINEYEEYTHDKIVEYITIWGSCFLDVDELLSWSRTRQWTSWYRDAWEMLRNNGDYSKLDEWISIHNWHSQWDYELVKLELYDDWMPKVNDINLYSF